MDPPFRAFGTLEISNRIPDGPGVDKLSARGVLVMSDARPIAGLIQDSL
jgi:hypothetical protein